MVSLLNYLLAKLIMIKKAISSLNITVALSFALILSSCATTQHPFIRKTTEAHTEAKKASEMKRHVLDIGVGAGERQALGSMKQLSLPEDRHYVTYPDGEPWNPGFGCVDLEYHWRETERLEWGLSFAWGIFRNDKEASYINAEDDYNGDRTSCGKIITNIKYHCYAILPSFRYTWKEDYNYRWYSRVAVGFMKRPIRYNYDDFPPSELPLSERYPIVSHHISQNYHFRGVYQLTAIGLRLGSGAFNLFGELGYGCLGIFRLGVGINL